jgi:hypothetical protein
VKTTELFVEQILIGAMALAAALLPWWPELKPIVSELSGLLGLAGGAVALGGAALTVLSAWTWWRIGATYRTYLREAASSRRAAAASA